MAEVSVVVVAWGDEPWLERCVGAILASVEVEVEVVLVDNGCTDGAVDAIEGTSRVRVMRPGENLGFAAGCNLGVSQATSSVVALVNPDAIVDSRAIAALRAELSSPGVGMATGCVVLAGAEDSVNAAGVDVHFLGLSWAGSFGEPVAAHGTRREVAAASGALLALRVQTWDRLGGFCPAMFAYSEDVDLSLRLRLSGQSVVYVPEARAVHRYSFGRNPAKFYLLDRNRLVTVLTVWDRPLLWTLFPLLVAQELVLIPVALAQGWFRQKVAAWGWLVRNQRWLRGRRRTVQSQALVGSRSLVPFLATTLAPANHPVPAVLRPFDLILRVYWRLVRGVLVR